jgi:predicted ATPase
MHLSRIEVTGFKSIRELKLDLRALNVLIGANGSGKSNFISLFRLLNEMAGKHLQVFIAQQAGANSLLYFGQKTTDKISVRLIFKSGCTGESDSETEPAGEIPIAPSETIEYECEWIPTLDDTLILSQEAAVVNGMRHHWGGGGHKESLWPGPDVIVIGPPEYVDVSGKVSDSLTSWRVYHFHDTSESAQIKKIGAINDDLYLRPDAGNLAAFLYRLKKTKSAHYEMIRDTIRLVAPFFDDFILRPRPENENTIQLEWRERGSDYPFLAHHLSDGTLRFMCLATLLLQPDLPSTILIDEPELGLHPYAINVLASLMRSAATRTQIIVSTQSVSLVDQFDPEDLLIVERRDQATVIERLDPKRLSRWLKRYSLSELWEKNVLGGRPSR